MITICRDVVPLISAFQIGCGGGAGGGGKGGGGRLGGVEVEMEMGVELE